MKTLIMYAIEYEGNLLGIECCGNDDSDGFCGSYEASLFTHNDLPWLTPRKEIAEEVLSGEVEWYNSDVSRPRLNREVFKDCKVVEVTLTY